MKLVKKEKWTLYLLLFILILLFCIATYEQVVYLIHSDKTGKLILYGVLSLIFIFFISFLSIHLNFLITIYPDIEQLKKTIQENFPKTYNLFSKKIIKSLIYYFSIFLIWNFSIYIKEISQSMVVIIFLFILELEYNDCKILLSKQILKTFLIVLFIYIISHFLEGEPKIKINFTNDSLLSYPPYKIILSFIKAILYMKFYVYLEKIIRFISIHLIHNKIKTDKNN